jgi:hypothetical protein
VSTLLSAAPSERFRQYTSFVSDIDLLSDGGRPCRAVLILSTGNVVLTPTSPISANETIVSPGSGTLLPVRATKIVASGTTITSCVVFW